MAIASYDQGSNGVSPIDTHIMIQSTKGKRAANAVKGTRAMLTALNAAVVVEDLRFPPGNHLEELKGNRAGQHSVRING